MDTELLASQLIRAVRGKRSQQALSKRIGSKSNVLYLWESGRRYPSAARFFELCQSVGQDVPSAVSDFLRSRPKWLRARLSAAGLCALLLQDLRGQQSISDLAKTTGRSRFQISRWLSGESVPRLPDFLLLIHASSFRLTDFVAALVSPEGVPLIAKQHAALESARRSAFESPWCHVVLRLLETQRLQGKAKVRATDIASEVGLSANEVVESLELLEQTDQVTKTERGWVATQTDNVDVAISDDVTKRLKVWAAGVGLNRLQADAPGLYSYNLFCVSKKDRRRLEALHRAYFRQVRAIVAESAPSEEVLMLNLQLFKLGR